MAEADGELEYEQPGGYRVVWSGANERGGRGGFIGSNGEGNGRVNCPN